MLLGSFAKSESTRYPSFVKDKQFYYEDQDKYPTWTQYFVAYALFLDLLDEDSCSQSHPEAKLFKTTRLRRIKIKKRKTRARVYRNTPADASGNATDPPVPPHAPEVIADPPSAPENQTEPEAARVVPVSRETIVPVNNRIKKLCHSRPISRSDCLRKAYRNFREGLKALSCYELAKKHFKICETICNKLNMKGDVSTCNWILGELSFQHCYYSKACLFYKKAIKTYDEARIFLQHQPSLSDIRDKVKHAVHQRARYGTMAGDSSSKESAHCFTASVQHKHSTEVGHVGDLCDHTELLQQIKTDLEDYSSDIHWQQAIPCEDAYVDTSSTELVQCSTKRE